MQELIALLKKEQEIQGKMITENKKLEKMKSIRQMQYVNIYKINNEIQEMCAKLRQLNMDKQTYQKAQTHISQKQKSYLQLMTILNIILLILATTLAFLTSIGITSYMVAAIVALLEIPVYHLYILKDRNTLKQTNIDELHKESQEINEALSELKKHQRIIEQENQRLETEYKNTQRHLQQLHHLLEQINEQKEQFTQSEDVIAPPIVKEPVKVHTKTKRKKKPINS